ncbi:MAG: hypothetical protein ABJB74_03365 [Gemmatimonas sp.]
MKALMVLGGVVVALFVLSACEQGPLPERTLVLGASINDSTGVATDSLLGNPDGLVIMPSGELVLPDHDKNELRIISHPGFKLLRTIGRKGEGPGEFNAFYDVAVAPDGRLAVSDNLNRRITIFDATGTYVRDIVLQGTRPGVVAFDAQGRLYVRQRSSENPATGDPIVQVLSTNYERQFGIGSFRPTDDPMGQGYMNDVRMTPSPDGGMWVLYRYQSVLEHYDAKGKRANRLVVPVKTPEDTTGPFIHHVPNNPNRVGIARSPVVTDLVASGDSLVLVVAIEKGKDSERKSRVYAYTAVGKPQYQAVINYYVSRIAVLHGQIAALRFQASEPARLDFYSVKP